MRRSSALFLLFTIQAVLLGALAAHAVSRRGAAAASITEKQSMVRAYGLTDLCLFTETRYTRHPALADQHSPFQDGPLSFDHFPSGSLAGPPPALVATDPHD